jgi:hypothetical protein
VKLERISIEMQSLLTSSWQLPGWRLWRWSLLFCIRLLWNWCSVLWYSGGWRSCWRLSIHRLFCRTMLLAIWLVRKSISLFQIIALLFSLSCGTTAEHCGAGSVGSGIVNNGGNGACSSTGCPAGSCCSSFGL